MKTWDLLRTFRFFSALIFCYSVFYVRAAQLMSSNEDNVSSTSLNNIQQSTTGFQQQNVSNDDFNSQETNDDKPVSIINDSPVENIIDTPPTEPLVFSQVSSENSGAVTEIINNDTPIVIAVLDPSEELQKRASLPPYNPELSHFEINEILSNETIGNDTGSKEDMPSFAEWAQKRLEEEEEEAKIQLVNSSSSNSSSSNSTMKLGKLRWKNYASIDCGAKVILANPEAQHTGAILHGSRDEYVLNPCNSRIWFIVELCEAIQLKKIDIANYELFSSSPKEFSVWVSDRFPTRDWSFIGLFTAKDERDVQQFEIDTETFGKYVKVEVKSHYGQEHYCPLSLFRVYGTSVFEALQKDDPALQNEPQPIDEDDDDHLMMDSKVGGNLLSSATDAVLSMVKKAAEVLGKVNRTTNSSQTNGNITKTPIIIRTCTSPSHYVVCTNCSDNLFGQIYELLSCQQKSIRNLVNIPFIARALENSLVCQTFGLDFIDRKALISVHSPIESFFAKSFIGAMCNVLAINHNKLLHNVSHQFANVTPHLDKTLEITPEPISLSGISSHQERILEETHETEPLNLDQTTIINSKACCSTDTTYTAQIKPSKSLATEFSVHPELNTAIEELEQVKGSEEPVPIDSSGEITDLPLEGVPLNDGEGGASLTTPPKESVFLRLSNRIKVLERNMSLSGQYLEELSKRYKKQVEEMQRVLEKTERTLQEKTTSEEERFKRLEDKLEILARTVEELTAEKDNWKSIAYWFFCMVLLIFLIYCYKKVGGATSEAVPEMARKNLEVQLRRNSVDVVRQATKKKRRRPSDQALKIFSDRRIRRKKTSDVDWVEDRGRVIEDIPFPLEESDSSTIQVLTLGDELKDIKSPEFMKTATASRSGRPSLRNGSIPNVDDKKERRFKKLLKKVF
ncbi:hypothetical protein ABEB36_011723 [Hypothenemus hampei]|uniref:SUN domain-containing protein n=1 Tax=Hypothenemus hampei TaxID=57062 RepID=A0ABD1E8Z3_HYPHA